MENASVSRSMILILNEAKGKVDNLYPVFLDMARQFPENIRRTNRNVFNRWHVLLVSVDTYTFWEEEMEGFLNLRLQNAPEDDGMQF